MEKKNSLLSNFVLDERTENKANPHSRWEDGMDAGHYVSEPKRSRSRLGRKPSPIAKGRLRRQVTTFLFGDNYEYALKRGREMGLKTGEICGYINMLIDEDRKKNEGEMP